MRKVTEPETITLDEIRVLAKARFGDLIKGVVDLERGILLAGTRAAIGAFIARMVRR